MPSIKSYADADTFLHTRGKPVPRKKVANNTYLVRNGQDITLLLHRTHIVLWTPDTITLTTGGWYTVTTKDRINNVLPQGFSLGSTKGTWYLNHYDSLSREWRQVCRYTDGLTLTHSHRGWEPLASTMLPDEQQHKDDRNNDTMRKLIGRYLKGLPLDGLAYDDSCTLCKPNGTATLGPGNRPVIHTYGDDMQDTQHLIDHMLDGVLPTGLLYAALTQKGYLAHMTHGADTVKRVLRAYLSNRLFVGATAPVHGRQPIPSSTGVTA